MSLFAGRFGHAALTRHRVHAYRREALRYAGLGFEPETESNSTFQSTARGNERRPQLRARAPRTIRRARNGNASGGEKRLAESSGSEGESPRKSQLRATRHKGFPAEAPLRLLPTGLSRSKGLVERLSRKTREVRKRGLPRGQCKWPMRKAWPPAAKVYGDARSTVVLASSFDCREVRKSGAATSLDQRSSKRHQRARRVSGGDWPLKYLRR
jgi:hypothetical protein